MESDNKLKHIAFIMDGNGRWAKKRGKPREYGHKFGAEAFQRVLRYCEKLGIKAVTFYAFSTENWKRPKNEVDTIMRLLEDYINRCLDDIDKYNISYRFIGDKSIFPQRLIDKITKVEKLSENNSFILNIALNYGGRAEIVHAVNTLRAEGKTGEITESDISGALYTKDCPEPDLIIRTGGEKRLSNFLMWQSAYSELYFSDTLWPDITDADIDAAISDYYGRKRRYGGV